MKCAICTLLNEKNYLSSLKRESKAEHHEATEAVASFNASNGMVIYICHQHLTANKMTLDKIVTKGEFPE
jgi:hypothetical protein